MANHFNGKPNNILISYTYYYLHELQGDFVNGSWKPKDDFELLALTVQQRTLETSEM